MASSLEELLAKEGFRGSKRTIRSRLSFHSDAGTGPLHSLKDQPRRLSVSNEKVKTERTISDVTQYRRRNELFNSGTAKSRMSSSRLSKREQRDEGLRNEDGEKPSSNVEVNKELVVNSSEHITRHEITEVREQEDGKVKDIYSNELSYSNRGKQKSLNELKEERSREMPAKDRKLDKRHGSSTSLQLPGHFSGNTRKNTKQQEKLYNRSNSKSFEDISDQNHDHTTQSASNLALDEVAVKALVSILNGHIKRFLKDEDFRTTLRHNCFSSLDFIELEEEKTTETKVITSLEQAIDTVEQAAEKCVDAKNLKRASLQLSIITGLSLNDLKFGFTCGIPNYKLSACAHLYLCVIYKIQKKDKVSAKHLLQVFCDSPFQARTTLLPELWEHLFAPHLSHLKLWYNKEADIIAGAPNKTKKLKLLEKLYNENLDSGTNIFSVYYKDWLNEGAEAPSVPSISIPSISVGGSSLGNSSEFSGSTDSFSPQPMVSKKLYDSVFGSFRKPEVDEDEDKKEEDNLDHRVRGSHVSTIVKQTCASDMVKYADQDFDEDFTKSIPIVLFHPKETSVIAEEELRLNAFNSPSQKKLIDDIGSSSISRTTGLKSHIFDSVPHIEENKFSPKKVPRSVLEIHDAGSSSSAFVSKFSQSNKESVSSTPANTLANMRPIKISSLPEDFPSIPNEFICPLTGSLFEEPVTLETGQTFERAAIKTWFEKGNRRCPITGNPLASVAIPVTNHVLKRLIDNWKSEHFSRVLNSTSQIVGKPGVHNWNHGDGIAVFKIEHLFSSLNAESKNNYAKHLISLEVLEFLLRRFELGNVEEKTHVLALLPNFIEVDPKCMNQIARDIDKKSLVELLHMEEITPGTNVMLLLTNLLTLQRRSDVTSFLSGLTDEDVFDTMHVLLFYLKNSPTHQKPLIAVLLLHFDLLVEPENDSIYREIAVNSIAMALDSSLIDDIVREKCCRVLLTLSGHFSFTGNIMTKTDLLKQAGYSNNDLEMKTLHHEKEDLLRDDTTPLEDEEELSQKWLMNLFKSLIGDGERPFLKAVSRCLDSSHQDLVTACLVTITWLSSSLSMLCNSELHLPAFLAVICHMKEILENGQAPELRTLASLSLLNFSKISECKTLLRTMGDDIAAPLRGLADVTWTAKRLLAIVCGEDL